VSALYPVVECRLRWHPFTPLASKHFVLTKDSISDSSMPTTNQDVNEGSCIPPYFVFQPDSQEFDPNLPAIT
jgi:hypothetical protein